MWSEDLDKKIRDAAGSETPAYNEEAWEKMKPLLDEHLPTEKKRRWILFLLFSIVVTGLAIYMFNQQRTQSSHQKNTAQSSVPSNNNERGVEAPVAKPGDNSV